MEGQKGTPLGLFSLFLHTYSPLGKRWLSCDALAFHFLGSCWFVENIIVFSIILNPRHAEWMQLLWSWDSYLRSL